MRPAFPAMPEQLSFFPPSGPRRDRLFFGIFPDQSVSHTVLTPLAQQLRTRHRLRGRPLAPERFHITLQHLDDFAGVPAEIVHAASEAAASLSVAAFEVTFDTAGSFFKENGNNPFVLRGGLGLTALRAFQKSLASALGRVGLGRYVTGSFTPHITLLYDSALIPEHNIQPVRWTVTEFTLIHSLLGETRHIPLARWPLGG